MKPSIKKIIPCAALVMSGIAVSSCSDMLTTDTESYINIDDQGAYNANDSLYSAMGVVRQLQSLGERYVLLGELRGDLVEVPTTADYSLQEISNFEMSADNSFSSRRDYYSVINNCNFALTKLDTLLQEHNRQVLLKDYVSIRTMRDWTFLQLGLTYGKAAWIEKPILTLEDAEKDYPTVGLDEIIDNIVADLTPFAGADTSDYGTVDNLPSSRFFMSPMLLLADLMLYKNNYEEAARLYYTYLYENYVTLQSYYGNHWQTSQALAINASNHLTSYSSETLAIIPYSSDAKDYHPNLVNLTYNTTPSLLPADWWVREMKVREHYFAANEEVPNYSILEGDTRGEMIVQDNSTASVTDGFNTTGYAMGLSVPAMIGKFNNNATVCSAVSNPGNPLFENGNQPIVTMVATYRVPHVYLRYAEAANRAGKPTIAFAVLKYGLRNEVLNNESAPKINAEERADGARWTNFEDSRFDSNRGSACRGRGYGVANASEYSIPQLATLSDSIEWVENRILEEMAAETAFEGNRFFDLLRMSRHNQNPDEWFAERVARRFADPASAKAKLSNSESRWLK